MKDDLIFMVTPTSQTVLTDGAVGLTTVARKRGCAITGGSSAVTLNRPGYYKVAVTATVAGSAAGNATLALYKGTNAIAGMTGSETITTASTELRTITIFGIVRVWFNEGPQTLSIINTGVGITASNAAMSVTYLG